MTRSRLLELLELEMKGDSQTMLIPLKSRLNEEYLTELLSYAVFPDPDLVDEVIREYESDETSGVQGLEIEGKIVGLIGYQLAAEDTIIVHHVAVAPEARGNEYGRGLMVGVIDVEKPKRIVAETDEDTVDFYRSIGFVIESIGESFPGVERFRCTYEVEKPEP